MNHPQRLDTPVCERTHVLLASYLLGLCALLLIPAQAVQAQPAGTPATTAAASAALDSDIVNSGLTAPLFYQLLLGEMQVNGGEPGTGYSLILDAARKQRDPLLYRRAVEVALRARSGDAALSAAQAWAQALPEAADAHRFTLQILLALNRVGETTPVLRQVIDRSTSAERNDFINAIPQAFGRVTDKSLALQVVREALADTLKQPMHAATAWTTLGRMELNADLRSQALASAKAGHAADPSSPFPALLALDLMGRGQLQAEDVVKTHLKVRPTTGSGAPNVALVYARTLVDMQRNTDARQLLTELTQQQAQQPEPWLLLGTLQVQDNTLPAATASLQTYLELTNRPGEERQANGRTQAYLLMAQIAERQQDFAAATAWLDRIENASDIMAAQMRRASLLAKQGQLPQARALLRQQPERGPEDARQKLAAEAMLLRDLKAWDQAFEVYSEAVARFPEDVDLLYDQSTMAEKMGRLDLMEQLLRRLIAIKPDYHHAYNALGYSLADRGVRLSEAKTLIEKAVSLAPADAYIQDSLGWVEFRLGNRARALEILQAAYVKRPDAEIAAHLGEVLWVSGQKDQAKKIWREGLLLANDNETLQSTLKRFRVQP